MSLHDELSRLADTAPRPSIDHSVWDRGRALRRRDRLVTSAVVLALVVIIGGLASLVIGPPRAFAPANTTVPDGAIPSRIVDVPSSVTGPLETDLHIGRGSVAFVASSGTPVVIGATDGRYHLLDLPDLASPATIALSPSGDRLAYISESAGEKRVVVWELLHTEFSAGWQLGRSVSVDHLAWSPDGTWVAYSGSMPNGRSRAGRINVPDGGELRLPTRGAPFTELAVSNDGAVAVALEDDGMVAVLKDGTQRSFEPEVMGGGTPGAFSPDSEWLALASGPGTASKSLHTGRGDGVVEHPFPDDTFDERVVRPVGWLDDRLQLLLVHSVGGNDAELVITTPEVDDTSTWRRSVGALDAGALTSLTLAVDLIPDPDGSSSQQFTHDFGEPDWPMSQSTLSLLIGLGVAGAVAVLLGLRWLWRRRTGVR